MNYIRMKFVMSSEILAKVSVLDYCLSCLGLILALFFVPITLLLVVIFLVLELTFDTVLYIVHVNSHVLSLDLSLWLIFFLRSVALFLIRFFKNGCLCLICTCS